MMADEADHASDAQELALSLALANSQRFKPLPPKDNCYNCDEPLLPGERFCDSDCRDDYQRRNPSL